ncbi:MAG: tRNA glutamyl-Q(34) synthetase GluQRS [Proteobacteria bacterium]|nr:tRNA glutamyl-Q(34) synthetase GluQRS [Pseudomonadota bacterium]
MATAEPAAAVRDGRHTPAAYVGRFAPSPTGDLHLGSLLAAVGSYLDARAAGGRWLLRIEDLDREREVPGCADRMLAILEQFGLRWDGTPEYQSRRTAQYTDALARLTTAGLTYPCTCSRRELSPESRYPGTCRTGARHPGPAAIRFRMSDGPVAFEDRLQGRCRFDAAALGDVVVRRRDLTFAYQLAVVVDDAEAGITDVVRGADLIDSTPWQTALQDALRVPRPRYAHLPLLTEPDGEKLAKSRRSVALDPGRAGAQLWVALTYLGQSPPAELKAEAPATLLDWGTAHWNIDALRGIRTRVVTD